MFSFRSVPVLLVTCLGLAYAPAHAATLQDVSYTLEFAGHAYFNVQVYDVDEGQIVYDEPSLEEADDQWGLPRLFPQFVMGDRLTFAAEFSLPDDPSEGPVTVLSCHLGSIDCTTNLSLAEYDTGGFDLFYGTEAWFRGSLTPGESLLWDYLPDDPDAPDRSTTAFTESGDLANWYVWRAAFTVIEETPPQPSAVPLPATALLLPAGLAGFAAIGRRRRQKD